MTQIFKFWFQIWIQRKNLNKNHFISRRAFFFSKINIGKQQCEYKIALASHESLFILATSIFLHKWALKHYYSITAYVTKQKIVYHPVPIIACLLNMILLKTQLFNDDTILECSNIISLYFGASRFHSHSHSILVCFTNTN